ncbi:MULTISPECIES: hypothetical protein [Desulfitobacterium]|nr:MULTISPECIES: hypothetical protein [Desulfitobacterium]MEA5024536.1 hypothetical protein [Desulfitobacterium hafniense]
MKSDIELVLATYNGGRSHVNQWIRTEQLKVNDLNTEDEKPRLK